MSGLCRTTPPRHHANILPWASTTLAVLSDTCPRFSVTVLPVPLAFYLLAVLLFHLCVQCLVVCSTQRSTHGRLSLSIDTVPSYCRPCAVPTGKLLFRTTAVQHHHSRRCGLPTTAASNCSKTEQPWPTLVTCQPRGQGRSHCCLDSQCWRVPLHVLAMR